MPKKGKPPEPGGEGESPFNFETAARLLASAGFDADPNAPPAEGEGVKERPKRPRPKIQFNRGQGMEDADPNDPNQPELVRLFADVETQDLAEQMGDMLCEHAPATVLAALALALIQETTERGARPYDVVQGSFDGLWVHQLLGRLSHSHHQHLNIIAALLAQFAVMVFSKQEEE